MDAAATDGIHTCEICWWFLGLGDTAAQMGQACGTQALDRRDTRRRRPFSQTQDGRNDDGVHAERGRIPQHVFDNTAGE